MRFVTYDETGRVYEITNLFDDLANPTTESWRASTCVIRLSENEWINDDAVNVPIYTVH